MSTDHKEFYLRARARTPGCYDVFPEKSKDAAYFIKGSVASRSGLKTLPDLGTDEQLFQVTESINSLRQRMYIVDLRSKEAYSLRKVAFFTLEGPQQAPGVQRKRGERHAYHQHRLELGTQQSYHI